MPTGYTEAVQSGKITEFPEFAMQCARAFGACISLRDAPFDAAIPVEFKPDPYHKDRAAEERAKLDHINGLSDRDVARLIEDEFAEAQVSYRDLIQKDAAQRARYEAMLAKVREWSPPTPDHVGLRDFMIEQLEGSMKFDCPPGSYATAPVRQTEAAWKAERIERLEANIASHDADYAKEVDRCASRTKWVADLRASLK